MVKKRPKKAQSIKNGSVSKSFWGELKLRIRMCTNLITNLFTFTVIILLTKYLFFVEA